MSEPLIYDRNGQGIKAAEQVGLNQYCPCWRITTFDGTHENFCPIAQVAAAIDVVATERDTQLAEAHAALDASEADAAALRTAISAYLGDVTLGDGVLRRALATTRAGAALQEEVISLRQERSHLMDSMTMLLSDKPRVGIGQRLQRWLHQRWG